MGWKSFLLIIVIKSYLTKIALHPYDNCHQNLSYKNRLTSISLSSVLSYTKWIPIVTT